MMVINYENEPNYGLMRTYAPGEQKVIKDLLEKAWRKRR